MFSSHTPFFDATHSHYVQHLKLSLLLSLVLQYALAWPRMLLGTELLPLVHAHLLMMSHADDHCVYAASPASCGHVAFP